MKTEKEWNADILKITMSIKDNFPELMKYVSEIPLKTMEQDSAEITLKNLKDYFDSLEAIIKKYAPNHL